MGRIYDHDTQTANDTKKDFDRKKSRPIFPAFTKPFTSECSYPHRGQEQSNGKTVANNRI